MTHSLPLDPGQISNPWSFQSRSNDRHHQRFETGSVLHDDMILSSSPPPQPMDPQPEPAMQINDTPPTDPRIASLKAIFPGFDDAVIFSVLESTYNDHDRALDVLLGMNDPSFVPPNLPPVESPHEFPTAPSSVDAQRLSQEALDEQYARRLAFEEQQAASREWQPQGTDSQAIYQPYQSRRSNSWGGQPQGQPQPQIQGQGGRDTMAEFQEGFNRIAESGKKTFSSIVSKVKAKMQEFDQGQGWSRPQNQTSQLDQASFNAPGPQQGAYSQPYQPTQPAYSQTWQPSQSRPARAGTYPSSPPRSGVSRPAATEPPLSETTQEPSYYDPNARGYDLYEDEEEIQLNDMRTRETPATADATPQGAATPPHPDISATTPPTADASSPPLYPSPASAPPSAGPGASSTTNPAWSPARSLSPTIAGARGTTPGAPGGVDFSKLGLLPKRPISLVQPQSLPTAGAGAGASPSVSAPRVATTHSESTTGSRADYPEPEFLENPFEDQR